MASTLLRKNGSFRRGISYVFIVCGLLFLSTNAGHAVTMTCANCQPDLSMINQNTAKMLEAQEETNSLLQKLIDLQKQTLEAIGPSGAKGSAVSFTQDTDFDAASALMPSFETSDIPDGITLGDITDLSTAKDNVQELYGIFKSFEYALDKKDGKVAARTVKDLHKLMERKRKAVAQQTGEAHALALYSLNQMPQAKATESVLENQRASARNLRSDTDALNRTMQQLLSRINHMIALQAKAEAMRSAKGIYDLPNSTKTAVEMGQEVKGIFKELGRK